MTATATASTAPRHGAISVFDLFKIGIGPSSSHTVGPMRAARRFCVELDAAGRLGSVARVQTELHGSLGATGKGHGSDKAVLLGLEGDTPEAVNPAEVPERLARIRDGEIALLGRHKVPYNERRDLLMYRKALARHPNGMVFSAFDGNGDEVARETYYSLGGGFICDEASFDAPESGDGAARSEELYPFATAAELLGICAETGLPISGVMMANECVWRGEAEVRSGLTAIWRAMDECIENGCRNEGTLPGGLAVRRRAAALRRQLDASGGEAGAKTAEGMIQMEWINLYALAVNEENAVGGRVVTAPTNGAAGILPAVLRYYVRFCSKVSGKKLESEVVSFLLTAAAIGTLYKRNASISGAEVGCQGEVGSACSMAAGALAESLGGTPSQVENAAEIGMEHNLGLTCDPVGGLVQIPCIERNAMGAVKAVNAARMALRGDGEHHISLDQVIKTMWETGQDMKTKYKETSRGGLAAMMRIPVSLTNC